MDLFALKVALCASCNNKRRGEWSCNLKVHIWRKQTKKKGVDTCFSPSSKSCLPVLALQCTYTLFGARSSRLRWSDIIKWRHFSFTGSPAPTTPGHSIHIAYYFSQKRQIPWCNAILHEEASNFAILKCMVKKSNGSHCSKNAVLTSKYEQSLTEVY